MAPHPLSNSAHFPLPLSYTTEGKLRLNDWRQIPRLRWYSEGLDSPSTQAPGALGGPGSPLPEFLEEDAVGEALAADADTLEDPVTAELVQHQAWLQFPSLQGSVVATRGATVRAMEVFTKPSVSLGDSKMELYHL